jgi:membrane protease YdiL (CAAX protease family)
MSALFFSLVTVFYLAAVFASIFLLKKKKFFQFTNNNKKIPIELTQVFFAFGVYIIINIILFPFTVLTIQNRLLRMDSAAILAALHLFFNVFIILFLVFFFLKTKREIFKNIWKDRSSTTSYMHDIKTGFLFWLLTLPLTLFTYHFLNFLTKHLFNVKNLKEQVAVEYLKSLPPITVYFFLFAITAVILAPFIEELLFRGFLQNFLKKYFSIKTSIFLSSFCFAIFHFAFSQKIANITILGTLFVLSCFLGILYEKQKSLLSPIILHAASNGFAILNIFLLKKL